MVFVVVGSTMIGGRAAAVGVGLAFGVAFVVAALEIVAPERVVAKTAINVIATFVEIFLIAKPYLRLPELSSLTGASCAHSQQSREI
jgi:ABC-type uncharacterized transport system permease subunit